MLCACVLSLLQVPALEVEVQVTGSANIITFTPYYPGCVPLQLVNHTPHPITFKQMYVHHTCTHNMCNSECTMYVYSTAYIAQLVGTQ